MRIKALLLSVAVLSACNADVLVPTRGSSADAAAGAVAPLSLTAWATSPQDIALNWVDNTQGETGWEIYRSTGGASGSFSLLTRNGPEAVRYTDGGLTPLTNYCYKVRSYRVKGKTTTYGDFSTTVCETTSPVPRPAPPAIVNVKPVGSTAVQVDWSSYSQTSAIRVERSADAGLTWAVAGNNVSVSPGYYVDAGLVAEQRVCYRLIGSNDVTESLPSNVDCTTPPATPSNITFTILSDSTYEVRWTDNSAVEGNYEIWVFGYRWNEYFGSCYDEIAAWPLLPANTTSVILSRAEGFMGVAVRSDGGGSEYVFNRFEPTPPPGPLCWGDGLRRDSTTQKR